MNNDASDLPPMTIVEAVQLIRTAEPDSISTAQVRRLLAVLEENPALHVLVGDEAQVQRVRAELEKRFSSDAYGLDPAAAPRGAAPSRSGRRLAVAAVLAVAGVAAAWFAFRQPSSDIKTEPRPAPAKSSAPLLPVASPFVPTAPPPVAEQSTPPPGVPAATAQPADPPEPPEWEKPHMELQQSEAILADEGDGRWILSNLDGREEVSLSGKAKRLTLRNFNGEAKVDTVDLDVEAIEVHGSIDGRAKIKLSALGGLVTFHNSVAGSTEVEVDAPGGRVIFLKDRSATAVVAGSTKLRITAQHVEFNSGMDGGSRADVTLTKGGSLDYSFLAGGAELRYRNAAAGDPPPAIGKGETREGGKLIAE
jgi:hypothetical protein